MAEERMEAPANMDADDSSSGEVSPADSAAFEAAELVALAETHGVDVDDDATKKDLIAALDDAGIDTVADENDENTEHALDAEFREWWSTASKEDRNEYQKAQAAAAE